MTTAVAVRRRVAHVMGLPVSLALRGRHADDARGDEAWHDAVTVLKDADAVFSRYRADTWVSRLGRGEVTLADCPPAVAEVLAIAERARVESGGAFDVRRAGGPGHPPLDTDGVVKGWAVQRASASLCALPGTDVCLSAGGDMVCHVADAGGTPWRIGVEDPHDPHRILTVLAVRRGAVATSGVAHRGQHVVDARTGRPPEGLASVTVVAHDLTTADVDATCAFAMGEAGLGWLESRGRRAIVVRQDGTVATTGPEDPPEETTT